MNTNTKVMIVEDDVFLSFVEEKIVTRLGYEVVGKATSGEEALERIEEYDPDILLIDVQLSGTLDGIDTVKQLRSLNFQIPVIFISGYIDDSIMKRAKEVDYVDYLVKPIDMAMLEKPLDKAKNTQPESYKVA